MTWPWILFIAGAYVAGSIPFGVLIGRARGIDIRSKGSRNIGASNVGRVLGRSWGLICLVLDMSKGAAPVIGAGLMSGLYEQDPLTAPAQWWLWMAVAMAALMGHMYSMFLRGGGGKGVATAFGALLGMWPIMTIAALVAFAVWVLFVCVLRFISLASMVAAMSIPFIVIIQLVFWSSWMEPAMPVAEAVRAGSAPIVVSCLLAAMVIWKHRGNLARLRAGIEVRVGDSSDV